MAAKQNVWINWGQSQFFLNLYFLNRRKFDSDPKLIRIRKSENLIALLVNSTTLNQQLTTDQLPDCLRLYGQASRAISTG